MSEIFENFSDGNLLNWIEENLPMMALHSLALLCESHSNCERERVRDRERENIIL